MTDYSRKRAAQLIEKISMENASRRFRMRALDAARLVEVAEWEGSERIRSQIPNLRGKYISSSSIKSSATISSSSSSSYATINKYLTNSVHKSPLPKTRSPAEKEKHISIMKNKLRIRSSPSNTDIIETNFSVLGSLQDLATRVRTEHARQRCQVENTSDFYSSTRSSSSERNSSNKKIPKNFRHMRVTSQQWQSPGHVQEVHSRLETIDANHIMKETEYPSLSNSSSRSSDSDSDSGSNLQSPIHRDLYKKTYEYGKKLMKEEEIKKKGELLLAAFVKVPRGVFSKLKGFLEDRRGSAYRLVLGLLSAWMPPCYQRPTDAAVSIIASQYVRNNFNRCFNDAESQPSFYSFVQLNSLNHENVLDELIHRDGQFHCPQNMAMIFPVGKMFNLEEGKKISFIVCSVNPGTSYWMDENDMPGLSREEGHVYLPSGPPEDFDSICLLGRRTEIDETTGKRRSSLDGVNDPVDPTHEYYRYLVQSPDKRAIAMWCVTFTPKKRITYDESKESKESLKESSSSSSPPTKKSLQRWEHRAQKKMLSKPPQSSSLSSSSSFDLSNVVAAAVTKEKERTSSWDNEDEAKRANDALEDFEHQCAEYTDLLQDKLVALHQQLEQIHLNYMNLSDEIHDDVRNNLTDVKNEKKLRKGALNAWKLQLLQTHMSDVRNESIPFIAKKELTDEQYNIYNEYFHDIRNINYAKTKPPGWSPHKPPIDSSIAVVKLKNRDDYGSNRGNSGALRENNEVNIELAALGGDKNKNSRKMYNNNSNTKLGNLAAKVVEPSIRVGNKIKQRRTSIVDMMEAFKQVGIDQTNNHKRRSSVEMKDMEKLASKSVTASDILNDMDEHHISAENTSNNRINELQVLEVVDDDGYLPLPPMTPDGKPQQRDYAFQKTNKSHFGLANKIFKPSTPKVKYHNKDRSLGGLAFRTSSGSITTISTVPKIDSGWMWKRGQLNKSKKRRWFELTPNQLTYRESASHSSKKGSLHLRNCVVKLVNDTDFKLLSPSRILYLSCETNEDYLRWIENIEHNIILSRRRK
jgi:hypothetical protein